MTTYARNTQRTLTQRVLALAVFGIGIAIPASLLGWQAMTPSVALREGAAGKLIATTVQTRSLPINTWTQVVTNTGNVTVQGVFSGVADSPLVVRQSNRSAELQLCLAGDATRCAPLAGVWAGPLLPTPAAHSATDFARYHLTADNLALWLGFGSVALLLVFTARAFETPVCADRYAGSDLPP